MSKSVLLKVLRSLHGHPYFAVAAFFVRSRVPIVSSLVMDLFRYLYSFGSPGTAGCRSSVATLRLTLQVVVSGQFADFL